MDRGGWGGEVKEIQMGPWYGLLVSMATGNCLVNKDSKAEGTQSLKPGPRRTGDLV